MQIQDSASLNQELKIRRANRRLRVEFKREDNSAAKTNIPIQNHSAIVCRHLAQIDKCSLMLKNLTEMTSKVDRVRHALHLTLPCMHPGPVDPSSSEDRA